MLSGLNKYAEGLLGTILMILFSFFITEEGQNAFGLLVVLGIGILHGANDLKIIQHYSKAHKNKTSTLFLLYIGVVLLGVVLFYWLPQAALPLFVLVSAFHFGEQHWEVRLERLSARSLFYMFYGGFIFSLLFFWQSGPSSLVIEQIVGLYIPVELWATVLVILSLILFLWLIMNARLRSYLLWEFLLVLLLTVVFWRGTLILAFATYFVFWHSLPSLKSQMHYLYGNVHATAWWRYFKSGAVYWFLALLTLVCAYAFIDFSQPYFLSLFFVFLAAITFPHAVVMELMFGKKE